jgi:hypothetical protein
MGSGICSSQPAPTLDPAKIGKASTQAYTAWSVRVRHQDSNPEPADQERCSVYLPVSRFGPWWRLARQREVDCQVVPPGASLVNRHRAYSERCVRLTCSITSGGVLAKGTAHFVYRAGGDFLTIRDTGSPALDGSRPRQRRRAGGVCRRQRSSSLARLEQPSIAGAGAGAAGGGMGEGDQSGCGEVVAGGLGEGEE